MGKPLDTDLRRRVVAAIEDGMPTAAAAERFAVSKAAAGAWARLKRATGDVLPKPQGSGFGSVLDPYTDFIDGLISADKDITLAEIAEQLGETHGLHVVPSTIWYFLDRRGITFKKKPRTQLSRNAPMSCWRVKPGLTTSWISTPSVWFLSTRQGPQRRWHARVAARFAANAAGRPCRTGIGRQPPLSAL